MIVRLLFFSVLRDISGAEEIPWTIEPGADVTKLLHTLYERWPALRDWDSSLLVAVDQTYVKRSQPLHENCEVAIMPPVQGG